jgi:large subunit ribosomal protein LP0
MEPGKTSFFQALGVPTKIARGTIEITTDLKLVEAGAKVGASEATLLNMLNISPFTYGMKVIQVYEDGQAFSPDVLDIEESQLLKAFSSAIATITTISLAANYPTLPSVIHSVINAYKNTIAVAVETDYSWESIDELKDRIANPDAYASAAPAAGAAAAEDAPAAAKEEEKKEESEAEESGDEGKLVPFRTDVPSNADLCQVSVVSSTKCRHNEKCPMNDCYAKLSLPAGNLRNIENDHTRS